MENLTEKYYLLEEDDPKRLYPMLNLKRNKSAFYLGLTEPIRKYDDFEFEFIKPYSQKSSMADYHYNRNLMLSERIVNILKGFQIYNIDYLDASLTDNKGDTNYDYYLLHIRNHIECLDKKRSIWTPPAFDPNEIMDIKSICLDFNRLGEVPLEKRLLFRLKESTYYVLFHESLVDAILKIDPINIRFISVGAWHSDISWELDQINGL